jgi:hypothetical protein
MIKSIKWPPSDHSILFSSTWNKRYWTITKYIVKGKNIKQWSKTISDFLGTFVKKNSNSCHMLGEEVWDGHLILFSMCVCFFNYILRGKNQVTT